MATAIEFENIGKQYRLGLVSTQTLSHDLNRWWQTAVLRREDPYLKIGETNDRSVKGSSDYVWALKDINFKVEQGDVVGIIGRNGAGKSTLLKLLSKVTAPTTGAIRARGRIGSLLEVGTGFHPEMTGRENIFMNGAILGMTKSEISRKLDEIVDFSGCERYLDTPVKRYSSGMMVRLGFAVAAHLDPEILVVDEVLAVGDAEFQKKAIGKMKDVSTSEGRTVLFVSHNMAAVRSLCKSGVVLSNGMVDYLGTAVDAIDHYVSHSYCFSGSILDAIKEQKSFIHINEILINHSSSRELTLIGQQQFVDISISGYTDEDILCDLLLVFKNKDEVPMAVLSRGHYEGIMQTINKGDFTISKKVVLPKYMGSGEYLLDIGLHQPNVCWYFHAPNAVALTVEGGTDKYGRSIPLNIGGIMGLDVIE